MDSDPEDQRPACCIYCRISQDREGAGLGTSTQERECRELADRLGLKVVHVFKDDDTSAYSGKPRKGYNDMLNWIRAGKIQFVLAWHTDRLHRQPRELEDYIDAVQIHGVITRSVKAGDLDLSTAHGQLVARQLGALARYESQHKGERVESAYYRRVMEQGGFCGGRRRFGWEKDGLTVIPAEKAEVRMMVRAILAGRTLRSIKDDLNDRGVRMVMGGTWNTWDVAFCVKRPRNVGIIIYKGQEVGEPGDAAWPPLVDEAEWRAACRILADPKRRTWSGPSGVRSLGSGLYVCGKCLEAGVDTRLGKGSSGNGTRVEGYRCNARYHLVVQQEPIDTLVTKLIVARLKMPDIAGRYDPGSAADLSDVFAEQQVINDRLEELGEGFAAGEIDGRTLRTATARLRDRLAELNAIIEAETVVDPLAVVPRDADKIDQAWEEFDLGQRRTILAQLMTVIVLPSPGRRPRFTPERVRIEWVKQPADDPAVA